MGTYSYDRSGARKPNKIDEANATRWDSGGRRKFVTWAEHTFLPAFEKAVDTSRSMAGELFGEGVFDSFLDLVHAPELRDFGKHFGYPAAGAKDDALIGMWGQTLSSLRLRHPGGRRVQTPSNVYERDLVVLRGIVETLKTLG